MKGLVSIYLLIILILASIVTLSSFQKVLYSLTQIKFYLHNQRAESANQADLLKQLKDLEINYNHKQVCLQSELQKLCYLNNSFSSQLRIDQTVKNLVNDNLLIDFDYYQKFRSTCLTSIEARLQLGWKMIHPVTCLQPKESSTKEVFYNYNLAIEELIIPKDQTLLVSGFTAINKLVTNNQVTIISLGELIIDDLVLTEDGSLTAISIRDQVRVRHYPIDASHINRDERFWQISLMQNPIFNINLKTLDSIAISYYPN